MNSIAILEARLESLSQRRTNDVTDLQRQLWLEKEAKRELAVRLCEAAARERNIQHSLDTVRIQSQADAEVMSSIIFMRNYLCN